MGSVVCHRFIHLNIQVISGLLQFIFSLGTQIEVFLNLIWTGEVTFTEIVNEGKLQLRTHNS